MANGASRRPAWFGWTTIVLGVAAALAWVEYSPDAVVYPTIEKFRVTEPPLDSEIFYLLFFAPLAVLALVLGLIDGRRVLRIGGAPLSWGLLGLVTGAGAVVACVAYVWLNGTLEKGPPPEAHFVLVSVGLFVLIAVAEELVFRGWLLAALNDRMSAPLAVLLSALAFSAFHFDREWLAEPESLVVILVNLLLGGLWFGLLAQRSGGLVAPIAAHFAYNVTEDAGFGLVPNPSVNDLGALANYDMVGRPLWGGGSEGLNASIAMTFVLVAVLIPLLPALARRPLPVRA